MSLTHKNAQNKRRHLRYSGNRFFLILLPNSKISRGPMTTICIIMLASKSNDCVQAERTNIMSEARGIYKSCNGNGEIAPF